MLNATSTQAAAARLAAQSDAIARLAKDAGAFAAVVAAFEAQDGEAVRWSLDRLELYPYCELICEWLRIKLCVLRCIEICGPPDIAAETPDLPQFVRGVVELAKDERSLRIVADAVACGGAEAYHAELDARGLAGICRLLCRWICSVRYERICEVVCSPRVPLPTDPAADLAAAARAIETAASGERLERLGAAVLQLDCVEAQGSLDNAGFQGECEEICRIACVWRATFVCNDLCRRPPVPLTRAYAVEEARNFALAGKVLASQPRVAAALVDAVARADAKAYGALVARLGLEAYCLQLCSWVGSLVCFEFCLCVCPNPTVQAPEWTNIGYILVASDIDATGRTTVARSGAGGVGYAFFESLELTGFCAATSSITSGAAMMYRFLYQLGAGAAQPIVDGMLDPEPFQVALLPNQLWPKPDASGNATGASVLTGGAVFVCNSGDVPAPITTSPAVLPAPAVGQPWYPPAVYLWPDATTGWIDVYQDTYAGFFTGFMNFASGSVAPGVDPDASFPAADIGDAIPASAVKTGSDVTLTFEATRASNAAPPDYVQDAVLIRVNNNSEVNELTLEQFETGPEGCCTPIIGDVTILVSVDHEEMGAWSLDISSCGLPGEVDLWPASSTPAGVTVDARGGHGAFNQSTAGYPSCSYSVTLTTTPLLTTGVVNRASDPNTLTFCICGP